MIDKQHLQKLFTTKLQLKVIKKRMQVMSQ